VFVGRAAEVDRLRAAFEDTFQGRFRLLLVSGEPGIGKTRTAEELTTYARMRGADVLWGRSNEGAGAPPFWPWVQVVRAWMKNREARELLADLGPGATDLASIVSEIHEALPGLSPPPRLDPEQARFRLFEGVTVLLRNITHRRPLVVILDGLHWADEASLLLLQFLAREIGPARLLVLGTYRDVELRRGHPLSETLAELARERAAERVLLRGLSLDEVGRFVELTTGVDPPRSLVETVHRETEGNPFFVHEVVRLLVAEERLGRGPADRSWGHEIPQGVREVIGRRLNRLSASCNEVLAMAAVLGRDFELRLLARVSGRDEIALLEPLEEAIAARLLVEARETPGRDRFAHALVRDTLYDELGAPRRVRLHRAAAEALERLSGESEGPRLAEIANHFYQSVQAGDPERTIAACERAADWARSHQAHEDAAIHLERAVQVLENVERPDPLQLCRLVVALAELQVYGREAMKTRVTALRGVELARQVGVPDLLARAALAYGANSVFIEFGRVDATMVGLLEEALAALGDVEPALRAALLLRLSNELRFSPDLSRSLALLEEARRVAADAGDPALLARAGLSFGMQEQRRDEAADESERLAGLARQGGDAGVEQAAWAEATAGAVWLGQVDRARRAIVEMRRLAEEVRTPWARYLPVRCDTMMAILEGRFDDAVALVRQGRQLLGDDGASTNQAQWIGSQLYVVARQRGVAIGAEQTQSYVERFPGQLIYNAYLCGVHLSAGERNEARRELGLLAADDFGRIQRNGNWTAVIMLTADHTCELEERRYAETLYALLRPFSGRCPGVGPMLVCLGPTDLRLGRLAMLLGRDDVAMAHLRDAIDLTARMGARPYHAESQLALGALLARSGGEGDRERALAALERALEIGRSVGMAKLIEDALARKLELEGVADRGGDDRTLPLGAPRSR
jgi:tetratricopeptide (TPR) repeat protein